MAHGGRAPQVKRAAADRIAAALDDMLDPALVRLRTLIDDDASGVALASVKEILDRHIGKATQRVELTIRQQAEQLAATLGLDVDELIAEAERIVAASK